MPFDGKEFQQGHLMLEKIDQLIGALQTEDRWGKGQLRTKDGKRCIMGVLNDIDAFSLLTRPILDAVRELTGKSCNSIERFNDLHTTDHQLVLAVLQRTRDNVLLGKIAPARSATLIRRVGMFLCTRRPPKRGG